MHIIIDPAVFVSRLEKVFGRPKKRNKHMYKIYIKGDDCLGDVSFSCYGSQLAFAGEVLEPGEVVAEAYNLLRALMALSLKGEVTLKYSSRELLISQGGFKVSLPCNEISDTKNRKNKSVKSIVDLLKLDRQRLLSQIHKIDREISELETELF